MYLNHKGFLFIGMNQGHGIYNGPGRSGGGYSFMRTGNDSNISKIVTKSKIYELL